MATWQQSGNPGGLLGSIGTTNSNAPQASDVNATLGYIRDNNDRERAGQNNMGLQLMQGLGGIKDAYTKADAAQQQKEFQGAYADAYANGDRAAMRQLAAKYPTQMEAVQKGMGFIDDDQRQTVGNLAASARLAANNPETFSKWLQSNATDLERVGVDSQQVAQMYQQNPQGFGEFADHLGLSALGPDKYFDVQDKLAGRAIDQGKLDESVRSNKATEAVQWAGNNIAQQNVNLRRMELDDKKYDRRIANETNALKLADLQDKRQQNQQAIEQGKRDKIDSYNTSIDTLNRTVDTANKVLDSPGFTGYFGTNLNPLSSRYIPGTDAADTQALVETLQSQGFLSGIQQMKGLGGLSNAEGEKVMAAIGSIKPGQSEKSAKAAIKTIIDTANLGKTRLSQKYGQDVQQYQQEQTATQQSPSQSNQQQSTPSGIAEGATATNPNTGQKVVFRGGQWRPM